MKLPQNSKDRKKVLALMGVGLVASLYGFWAGFINPLRMDRQSTIDEIAELQAKLQNADSQISRIPQTERELLLVVSNLMNRSVNHILYPRLGNYLLPVREILGQQAQTLDIGPVQADEIGLISIPHDTKSSGAPAIRLYAVRVSVSCGYEDLRKWFMMMAEENPLLSVGNVMITAQRDNPLQHQITFELHWPVWQDAEFHDDLLSDLESLEEVSQ